MSVNARTRQRLAAPQFGVECFTSEHSAPLTTPGAGSTVNINRGRRLGPPARKQETSQSDSRQSVGVVLEMPAKSVEDAPVVSELAPELAEPQYSVAALASPSQPSAGPLNSPAPGGRPVHRRSFWLGAIGVALLGVISGTVWHVRAKHARSSDAQALVRSADKASAAPSENSNGTIAVSQPAGNDEAGDPRAPVIREASPEKQPGAGAAMPPPIGRRTVDLSANQSLREERSNSNSPVELANRYLRGQGVPRSCDKAVSLLTKAAEKGNVRACNQIASMYAIGSCVSRDRVQAYRWLGASLAADPHNDWAQHNRDLVLSQMTTAELSRLKANR